MLEPIYEPDTVEPERVRPLARREYDKLVELGMFEDERIELLRGVLVTMSPQGGPHAGITAWLTQRLILDTKGAYVVRSHSPFAADDYSEPEPDVLVARREGSLLVHPERALLLIEVADSSLRKDRRLKLKIYAEAGVPEYWIVELSTATVIVHADPKGGVYTRVERLASGDVLRPTALPGVEIGVAEIPQS